MRSLLYIRGRGRGEKRRRRRRRKASDPVGKTKPSTQCLLQRKFKQETATEGHE